MTPEAIIIGKIVGWVIGGITVFVCVVFVLSLVLTVIGTLTAQTFSIVKNIAKIFAVIGVGVIAIKLYNKFFKKD